MNPSAVIGSVGDSWIVRGLGKAVRDVEEEKMDWSRWRYRRTVPSPRPMARWESVAESATDETWK